MAFYMGMGFFECPMCGAAYIPQYWGDDDEHCIECSPNEASHQDYNWNGKYLDIICMSKLIVKQGLPREAIVREFEEGALQDASNEALWAQGTLIPADYDNLGIKAIWQDNGVWHWTHESESGIVKEEF